LTACRNSSLCTDRRECLSTISIQPFGLSTYLTSMKV